MTNLIRFRLPTFLTLACLAAGIIGTAKAETVQYDFTGVISKIPTGGTLSTYFEGFLGQTASFSYSIDITNINQSGENTYGPILNASFAFHTITGALGMGASFYVYSDDTPYPYTNFGIADAPLSTIAGVSSDLSVRFTQFTLANLSTNVLGSARLPVFYSLDDYPIRVMQLTFDQIIGDPRYSDQLRADFNSLTITGLPPIPEPSTFALFGVGLLGVGLFVRRKILGRTEEMGTISTKIEA